METEEGRPLLDEGHSREARSQSCSSWLSRRVICFMVLCGLMFGLREMGYAAGVAGFGSGDTKPSRDGSVGSAHVKTRRPAGRHGIIMHFTGNGQRPTYSRATSSADRTRTRTVNIRSQVLRPFNPNATLALLSGCTHPNAQHASAEERSTWSQEASWLNSRHLFCRRHNLTCVDISALATLQAGMSPKWGKLRAIRAQMEKNEWVLWIDCDAMITNQDVNIRVLIAEQPEGSHVLLQRNWGGMNMGVMLIRTSPWAKRFMDTLVALQPLVDLTVQPGVEALPNWLQPTWKDQNALSTALRLFPNWRRKITVLGPRQLQGFVTNEIDERLPEVAPYEWVPGDFIAHFANCRTPYCFRKFRELHTNTKRGNLTSPRG